MLLTNEDYKDKIQLQIARTSVKEFTKTLVGNAHANLNFGLRRGSQINL